MRYSAVIQHIRFTARNGRVKTSQSPRYDMCIRLINCCLGFLWIFEMQTSQSAVPEPESVISNIPWPPDLLSCMHWSRRQRTHVGPAPAHDLTGPTSRVQRFPETAPATVSPTPTGIAWCSAIPPIPPLARAGKAVFLS